MKKIYLLVMGIVLLSLYTTGQISAVKFNVTPVKKCATADVLAKFNAAHPGSESISQFESWISQKIAAVKATPFAGKLNPIITVPVVFHIIHDAEAVGSGRNVSQAAIRQQVLQINKDYANLSNSPYAVAEDMGIRFALAQKDPNGTILAEPGIDRIDRNLQGWSAPPYTVGASSADDFLTTTIKPSSIWDPTRYVNIWISEWEVNILGISTFPASSTLTGLNNAETNTTAGVAISYTTVGSVYAPALGDCTDPYGKGKTLTHELGHYFGLRHIWGDANCATDYCGDTPIHFTANSGEPSHPKPNSCGTADEMFENYMDYSDDASVNTFTVNQGDRMEAVFANSPRRGSLATSNAGLVLVTASNSIAFADCDGATSVSEKSIMSGCPKYTDFSFELNVEDHATAATVVTVSSAGTAVNGVDYQLMTPTLSFATGDNFKPVTIRVFDNAVATGNRTIILSYSIGTGGGVTAGAVGQSLTVTLVDDDYNAAINQTTTLVTLLSQDFGTVTMSNQVPTGWTVSNSGLTTNKFVVNNTASANGFAGNAAHISNGIATLVTNGTAPVNYSKTAITDARITTPSFNATGLKNITISFDYVSNGEADYDLGLVYYSLDNGTSGYQALTDAYSNVKYFQGVTTLTHFSATLPPSASGAAGLKFLFRWVSDNTGGTNPPFVFDNVVITGSYQGVETVVNSTTTQIVNTSTDSYLYSTTGAGLIARINNPSVNIGCLTALIQQAGNGLSTINTTSGSYQRSDKVIKLTPTTPNTTASYQATFYYTTAEVANWGANVPTLKIMKVSDAASLTSTLTPANSALFTPVVDDQRTSKGYVSYTINATGGFSQFILVSPATVLPVLSLNFTAKANDNNILLNWTTNVEIGNKGFAIERSTDGFNFEKIGWVDGQINSTSLSRYSFTDNFVQPNTLYYYHLRQTDMDNRFVISETRQAKIKGSGISVIVSPNPATDFVKLFISGTSGFADISLFDTKGQLVRNWTKLNISSAVSLNVSNLASGIYIFNIKTGEKTQVEKLIIK